MRALFQFIFAVLAVLLFPAVLLHAETTPNDGPFLIDSWSTADGLPQSSIISMTQTHDGYLWLGTLNGLVRFDGSTFTHFNVNNTPGLPNNRINFLFEDTASNLWIGTDNGGFCLVKNGLVQKMDVTLPGGRVIYATEDTDNTVWFCTDAAQFFSATDGQVNLHPRTFPENLYARAFHLLAPVKNGDIWSLENGRVAKFHGINLLSNYGSCPWTYSAVTFPYPRADGSYHNLTFDLNITALCVDNDGNLVVGTHDAGIYWYGAAGQVSHISTDKGLSHNSILSLCCDHEGNLWVGTDGDGLERISKKTFTVPAGFSTGVAQSVAEDARGGLWATFNRHGLIYTLTNSTAEFQVGVKNNAWTVLVDNRQQVWAGTRDEGLFHFDSTYFQPVYAAQIIGPQIYALFQSRDGKMWVGGQNGLGCYNGSEWKFYSTTNGLPANAVRALAEDATHLWIGTDGGGLFSLHDGIISPANAPVKEISCLLVDRDNVLWAGTSGHGLARLDHGQWTTCASRDGLAGDDVGYLIEDNQENLWLGSYEGLARVGKKSLADFAVGSGKKISCRLFLTRECSAGAQPAALRASDGRLLFPTINGIVAVNPDNLRLDTNAPPVVIESVLVDGLKLNASQLQPAWIDPVVLSPNNEQLEIHFTSLSFSAPKGAQFGAHFKYRLEGRDKIPTDAGEERVAHFSKLTPGNYIFHVIACNEDGIWNDLGATLAITVQPPFWETTSFLIVTTLIVLGLLAGIIYLVSTDKLKRQLRALHQKELIEHERARIARDLHDQLGANLTQVTLLGEMAEADKEIPAEVEQHAQQICATARETTRSLDEIVWAVNPSNDTLEGLANYACKYAQDYFALAGVSYRAELPTQLPPIHILPEVRHNVFLAFKEAVNNVVKHAHATEARVKLQLAPGKFILSVTDNGRGLGDLSGKNLRNGLKNMRRRLADVSGEFEINPGPNGGTVVQLIVPIGKASL